MRLTIVTQGKNLFHTCYSPFSDQSNQVFTLEVDDATDLGTVKSLIEVETRIPVLRQQLMLREVPLSSSDEQKTMSQLRVSDDEILLVADAGQRAFSQTAQTADAQAQQLIDATRVDPNMLVRIRGTQPGLAGAIERRDVKAVGRELKNLLTGRRPGSDTNLDPLSAEAQELAFEQLKLHRVAENFEQAQEHLPESFAEIVMLYVKVEINNVPMIAFVDSGAQSTIMSESCAARCGLDSLIDRRYQGVAKGVGEAKVVGRIHMAQLKCGGIYIASSLTILADQKMDVLFGLGNGSEPP